QSSRAVPWSSPRCSSVSSRDLPLSVTCFFFFQAEDGIRDATVTGVQTCALPISPGRLDRDTGARAPHPCGHALGRLIVGEDVARSEERRVGKECRCRWAPEQ